MKPIRKTILAFTVALALAITGAAMPASAKPTPTPVVSASAPTAPTASMVAQAQGQLEASPIPRTSTVADGYTVTVYQLDAKSQITFGMPLAAPSIGVHTNVSVGINDGHGHPFIKLNTYDQDTIINGAGWAIGLGICAISAGVPFVCPFSGLVITLAAQWLSANGGHCSRGRQLLLPFFGTESAYLNYYGQIRCV